MMAYFNDLGIEALYEYDYGDSWVHTFKLEGYVHRAKGIKFPIYVDGECACPPEDFGGPFRYHDSQKVLPGPESLEVCI